MKPIKILFVCHGNICRSPMAEFVMRKLARDKGVGEYIITASAATSSEELGNPVYPPARRIMEQHGISCYGKTAVRMKKSDYDDYDLIVCMDDMNCRNILRIIGSDPQNKVHRLMSFTGSSKAVADPWYTGDFETTWKDVNSGCEALLQRIIEENDL